MSRATCRSARTDMRDSPPRQALHGPSSDIRQSSSTVPAQSSSSGPKCLPRRSLMRLAEQRLRWEEKPHPLGTVQFFRATLGEQQIVGAALRTRPEEDERLILVFKDEQALDVLVNDVVRDFPFQSLRLILPLFAWLLLAGGLSVWRRTRPIAEFSVIAETIGPQTLNLRLPEQDVPREVLPIVHSVNGALARLERAASAQQEFLRRAAHQLRTPLTILSARVAAVEDTELAGALRGDIGEISRIVSQLLQLNEIDALPDSGDSLADLGAVAEAVCDELTARAARLGVRLDLVQPDEPVLVRGDPNVIQVAVQNLVDNALQNAPIEPPSRSGSQLTAGSRLATPVRGCRRHCAARFSSRSGRATRAAQDPASG